MNIAIGDSRPQKQIIELQVELNNLVVNYSKKYFSTKASEEDEDENTMYPKKDEEGGEEDDDDDKSTTNDKFIIAQSIQSFHEMINKKDEEKKEN